MGGWWEEKEKEALTKLMIGQSLKESEGGDQEKESWRAGEELAVLNRVGKAGLSGGWHLNQARTNVKAQSLYSGQENPSRGSRRTEWSGHTFNVRILFRCLGCRMNANSTVRQMKTERSRLGVSRTNCDAAELWNVGPWGPTIVRIFFFF